jgi:hypothetical protein
MDTTALMTETEARNFRTDHDAYVRTLSRQTKSHLASMYRQQLAAHGRELLYGGPASKDELISAISNLNYPIERLNESIHVLYHQDSDGSSACEWCHPHSGGTCDCALGR